jgi:hypothetical protein
MAKTMLKVYGGGGEKPTVEETRTTGKSRTSLDDTADVRDILNAFVGRGITGLGDEGSRSDAMRLRTLLGNEKANKLLTSLFIHNQRSASLPMEQRIQTFYDVGSNDKDVGDIITNVKSFGYGPLAGFRDSSKQTNQILTGKIPGDMSAAATDADLQRRIMLRLNK